MRKVQRWLDIHQIKYDVYVDEQLGETLYLYVDDITLVSPDGDIIVILDEDGEELTEGTPAFVVKMLDIILDDHPRED